MGPTHDFCEQLHQEKYRQTGESFKECMNRIASALSDNPSHFYAFRNTLLDMRFLPGGRVQAAAGAPRSSTLYNCFVIAEIADSFVKGDGNIMQRAVEAATTLRMGGGVGYDFSTLRPNGAMIRSLGSRSTGPVAFMSVFNSLGDCTAAVGNRRGAQMAVLRIDHPDVPEFIRCKQNAHSLTRFNISLAVTEEFMEALDTGKPFPLRFNGTTYSEVDPAELWESVMRSTWDWAEPGVLFIDRINKMNNLWYAEKICSTNPCLDEETLISSRNGFVKLKDISEGVGIQTVDGIRPVTTVERHTDVPVYRVSLTDGTELRATGSHIFHVQVGKKFNADTKLIDLSVGDKIRLVPAFMPTNRVDNPFHELTDREYGFVVGVTLGDGCFTEKSRSVKICCGTHEQRWAAVVNNLFQKIGYSSIVKSTDSCVTVCSSEVMRRLDESPVSRGYSFEKHLPLELLNSNKEFLAGYIDGLISTDGNVHRSPSNPMIRVTSTSREQLMMLKRALSCFGVLARVYETARKPSQILGRDVTVHDSYVLCILGSGIRTIYKEIGISHPDRQERLQDLVLNYSLTGCTWSASVRSIEPDGFANVVDLYESVTDTWVVEGVVNRGCGEQPLPPNGACLLGSFNLTKYLNRTIENVYDFDYQQLMEDIRHVVRAMDNVIDRSLYPLEAQRVEATNKRRMGLGVCGLANAGEALGFPYGSAGFLEFEGRVLAAIRNGCYSVSAKLAAEKGSFPLFDKRYLQGEFIKTLPEDVREEITRHGIRNSHLTSIAPTGTISQCADNVSSGIEPVFDYVTKRVVNMNNGPVVVDVPDYGFAKLGVKGRRCRDVTAKQHVDVLIRAQKNVDSSVSKTCNVAPDTPWEEFKQIYMDAYNGGAKGCTTYQIGCKRGAVLTETSCAIDPTTGEKYCS